MKVRRQKNPDIRFATNVKACYKNEGIRGFYKGMFLPITTISFINAISLVGNEFTKKMIGKNDKNLTIPESLFCGFAAGLYLTPFVTVIENVKCKLQIQNDNKSNSYYKGVRDLLTKTIKKDGIKGIFKGNVVTLFRETISYAGQFCLYHTFKLHYSKKRNVSIENLTKKDYLISGGISGMFGWFVCYPFDVAKTLIQTGKVMEPNNIKNKERSLSFVKENVKYKEQTGLIFYDYKKNYYDGGLKSAFNHIYLTNGLKGFTIGFLPLAIITTIGNAVMF